MAQSGVGTRARACPARPAQTGSGLFSIAFRTPGAPTALLILLLSIAVAPLAASAATVAFEAEDRPNPGAEDVWRYHYLVSELELQVGQSLAVQFDPDLYGALTAPQASDPSDWDALAIQPDALLPDDGALDLRALVAQPTTNGSFQIDVVWKGPGTPGAQPFVVYDAQFQGFETGFTVPEPGAGIAGATVLAVLAWLRRRRKRGWGLPVLLAAGCALGAVATTPASAAEPVVHEYDAGDYRVEYWLADSTRVDRTVTDFRFAARIVSESGSGVPRVVAFAASGAASSLIVDEVVVFGDIGPFATVDGVDTFTLRQDRTVPFDPLDVSFTVSIDSDYPCAPLSLASASGLLGEKIPISGLEEVIGEDTRILAVGPLETIVLPVAQETDGSYFLTSPIHPDLAGEAGTVSIVLETAGAACPLGDLALPALPAADADEVDEILALTEQVANAIVTRFGFDPGAFDPAAPGHSAAELSVALLWRALLYQESPTNIATQRAALAGLSESERILIGRMLAATGVRTLLEEMLLRYEDLAPPPSAPAISVSPVVLESTADDSGGGASIGPQSCLTLDVEKVPILTAGELSRAMRNAQSSAASFESETVRRGVAAALFGSAALAGLPGVIVSDVTGSILLAQSTGDENPAKLLPSRIVSTRIEATVNPINEDHLHGGTNPHPRWRAFTTAESKGLDLRTSVGLMVFQAASGAPLTAANAVPLESFDTATEFVYAEDPPEAGCFRVPPHTWTDINVSEVEWLEMEPSLSGSSITLLDTLDIQPVDIGTTNIEVQLSSDAFPCDGCTLGDISADIDIEVLQKEISFSMAQFPIPGSSGIVNVTGAIQNSSFPGLYAVSVSPGGAIVSPSPPNPQFSFSVQGLGNDADFPLSLTVTSNSLTLPSGTPNRMASAPIVLDPMIVMSVLDDGCIEPGRVVPINAQLTGLADTDVTFDQPPGTVVTQVNENQAEFSAGERGIYVVTATSVSDPSVTASIELVVGNCDIELYLYLLGYGHIDTGEQANPPCGTGVDPEPIEVWLEPATRPDSTQLRTEIDMTVGGPYELDIVLDQVANATVQPVETCYSTSHITQAIVTGTLEGQSIGQEQTLEIDLTVGVAGGCTQFEPGLTRCYTGVAFLDVIAPFVFEHTGQADQAYEYVANAVCSLIKPNFLPPQNISINTVVVDANGATHALSDVTDLDSRIAMVRARDGMCYAGEPVSIEETVVFKKLLPPGADENDPGIPYTVGFMVTLNLDPIVEIPFPASGVFSNTGTMDGFVRLRPVAVPAE